jgi:thioredoxin reductase (NADPH)
MADIKVYGAPWCPDCRRSKQFLNELRVPYAWVDIDKDPQAASFVRSVNNGKQIIPTIVFPDGSFLAEPGNDELARKLGLTLKARRAFYDLVIIGGGPTGLTSAIYAAREGISSLVIEKSALGGQAGVTERIDNYPGFPGGIRGAELAERVIDQARGYGVELLSAVGVKSLAREGDFVVVTTETGDEYCAYAAIVATGSTYRRLDVPGEEELIGAGIHFCATCDGPFYKGSKELVVIGGGNSAVEEGLFLSQFTDHITLIEFMPDLKASSILQEKIRSDPKFTILTNTEVTAFRGNGRVNSVVVRERATSQVSEITAAGVFVFIGMSPNSGFVNGVLETDGWGFIQTDASFQTSMPGVFAAGDVRSGSTKQLASATGEGVTALIMVRQHLQRRGELPIKVAESM